MKKIKVDVMMLVRDLEQTVQNELLNIQTMSGFGERQTNPMQSHSSQQQVQSKQSNRTSHFINKVSYCLILIYSENSKKPKWTVRCGEPQYNKFRVIWEFFKQRGIQIA